MLHQCMAVSDRDSINCYHGWPPLCTRELQGASGSFLDALHVWAANLVEQLCAGMQRRPT